MGGGSATPCYYAVLGVPRNASAGDITAAYRRKVQILHPLLRGEDSPLTKQAEAMFHQLREAYEVLSDASQRAAYDANVCQAEPDDPARASLSNDPVIEEMRSRLARMREFLSSKQVATDASVQQPKLTREEMQERKKEMNKGFVTLLCPSSMSSRSGAEPSGSGPRTAVWISGGGKQSIHFIARANANPRCILLRRSPTNSTDKAGSWC